MHGLRLPTATAGRKNFGSEYAWHMEAYDRLCVQSHSIRPPERIAGTPICRLSHMERPAKDRRRTGLKTSRHRASGDAAGRPVPDRPGQPSYPDFPIEERKRGPARRIQQTRSGKELRTESVSNPFPDHIPTRSTRLHSSGAVSSHFPSRLRSFPRASRGLPRVPTDDYGRSRSSDGRCVRPAGSSM